MSFTSVDFPEPETPVTTVSRPSGKTHVDIFQVIGLAAQQREHFAVRRRGAAGTGMATLPER